MRVLTTHWPTSLLSSRGLSSELFNEVDRFFGDLSSTPAASVYDERDFSPASEVAETDDYYLMSVDLPGLKKEDIKIELNENTLRISGERKRNVEKTDNYKVHFYEKRHGVFKKAFQLPTSVDGSKIEARFEDGVLELYLPKTALAKPRQIEIKSNAKEGFFEKLLAAKKTSEDIKDVAANKTS